MARIQLRRDTAANWTAANPTLASGEKGIETDTGKEKTGNGTTAWNALSYLTAAAGPHKASHEPGGSDALTVDAAAATGSLRTLGTTATSAAAGNDARLSDARTPTAHRVTHGLGGSDALTAADLATGTADASTFLRGDRTWATPAGGGVVDGATSAKSGSYYVPMVNSTQAFAAAAGTVGRLILIPIHLRAGTLDRIAVNLNATPTAGEVARLCIYGDVNGYPDALLLDAGTVDLSAVTGKKEITINQAVTAGVYWLGSVRQGPTATAALDVWNGSNTEAALSAGIPTDSATLFGSSRLGLVQTGVTGALPANFTATPSATGNVPLIAVRYA